MENLKVIRHPFGGERYENVVGYPIKGDALIVKGYGVSPYDKAAAVQQMKSVAEYFNNESFNAIAHTIIAYSSEAAPTPQRAIELTEKILGHITNEHQAITAVHCKERENAAYHTHTIINATNYKTGRIFHGDNSDLFPIAIGITEATGNDCLLTITKEIEKTDENGNVKTEYQDTYVRRFNAKKK